MTARTTRLDAGVRTTLQAVGAAARRGLDDPALAELVQIRASQLNHCAFCLDMHLAGARRIGVSERQLDLLNTWEEAGEAFDERERAALALTEAVTVLTDGFAPDEVYEQAAKHFDETRIAHLIALITTINSWNRLMVARRIPPGSAEW
ncbi:carboxymuconolactone decarboxylase family protein [Streptomyces sp. NPDC093228]|uniref:carboxymuconolactone decarboxylase family protein n=1 Tax=unclassified Streptomyces TaxID=2593676 RepID=UPI000740D67C|nr:MULTISPECIES: carboxymuconolactone decarboxylase family protein [unclassified Streptomyces]KUJ41525.1 alkylhydroperoxidase [Streptomyces sp. NRRL F-5122]MDX3261594.1 carboxymuconolactone decarboxylase family protein [Streptomyces sp. MI02-2A]REE62879.1 AhpD family alkylhydroperoxidase [Streptomyces sp. 3212.3]